MLDNPWRSWLDTPPQIPWAPVEYRYLNGALVWRPSGIYREEFWSVTGEWI